VLTKTSAIAVVITRSTPGPAGLYIVSVGYYVAGVAGAIAAWAAMITPAFAAVGLLRLLGRRAEHPRAAGVIQGVVLASAGLLWAAALPLGRQAITYPLLLVILVLGGAVLASRKIESVWVMLGSSALYFAAAALRIVPGL
jgi:chromate transporter